MKTNEQIWILRNPLEYNQWIKQGKYHIIMYVRSSRFHNIQFNIWLPCAPVQDNDRNEWIYIFNFICIFIPFFFN